MITMGNLQSIWFNPEKNIIEAIDQRLLPFENVTIVIGTLEEARNAIIEMVHHNDELIKVNFSEYLSEKLNHDYTYLANLFSEVQGTTIEQFIISHKIERIKELIIYDELNITEIAWKMNYSSVAHLSNQFKKVTGLSPSHFKQMKDKRRSPIEDVGNSNSTN